MEFSQIPKQLNYRSYISRVRHMYDKPVTQTSSALILTLITITFFGLAAIRPTLSTVSQLVGEIEEKRNLDEKITQKLSSLATAQENYLQNQDVLSTFEVAIPPQHNHDQLLLQIEYLAEANAISLNSLRILALTTIGNPKDHYYQTDPFPSYEVRFTAEGEYDQIKNLLDDVSRLDRILRVESVTFTTPSEDQEFVGQRMDVGLRAYWAPPKTALEPQSSTTPQPQP